MERKLTNYRYWILAALAVLATVLVFAVPAENLPADIWAICLVSSKLLGIGFAWAAVSLSRQWERKGTISDLTRTTNNF